MPRTTPTPSVVRMTRLSFRRRGWWKRHRAAAQARREGPAQVQSPRPGGGIGGERGGRAPGVACVGSLCPLWQRSAETRRVELWGLLFLRPGESNGAAVAVQRAGLLPNGHRGGPLVAIDQEFPAPFPRPKRACERFILRSGCTTIRRGTSCPNRLFSTPRPETPADHPDRHARRLAPYAAKVKCP